jgi:hypothetical protein
MTSCFNVRFANTPFSGRHFLERVCAILKKQCNFKRLEDGLFMGFVSSLLEFP